MMREISKSEVLRYAGCKQSDSATEKLFSECVVLSEDKIKPQFCYKKLDFSIKQKACDFGTFSVCSNDLAQFLCGAEHVFIFAATLGFDFDRLIAKYSKISPAKACMLQAIGVERIEAYADEICQKFECEFGNSAKRFSAGYGDLPLNTQKNIFQSLDCTKKLGITLNQSLLMSPTKSVTAFVGLFKNEKQSAHKCNKCNKIDCAFRR